ncbi:MAG: hypothetical protein FWD17_02610 [Polyangiaceae bacterium]|nr:hypothetical protein [Polyangiaceae bacterium]
MKTIFVTGGPGFLHLAGRIGDAISIFTRRAPTVTRGIARILAGDLRFSSDRAIRELGYAPVSLDAMLDDLGGWWAAERAPRAGAPRGAPAPLG